MKRLRLVGLSHRIAPVGLREQFALEAPDAAAACHQICRRLGDGAEAVLLSTCNRVELYTATDIEDLGSEADPLEMLCSLRGVQCRPADEHVYRLRGDDAVRHLFTVAASLDSLVPGEQQILGQVREAYERAKQSGTAGRLLHGLFQRALAVGKEVMHATDIGGSRQSVASATLDRVDALYGSLSGRTVLCLGAGRMARLFLEGLGQRKPERLIVCSRDEQRAADLARQFGAQGRAMADLEPLLASADVVLCTTGSRLPLITAEALRPRLAERQGRPLWLFDIAVPRDVDPAAGRLPGVHLVDVDGLQPATAHASELSAPSLAAAAGIVERHVTEFLIWQKARDLGPMLDQLYQQSRAMAAEEVARTLRKLPELDGPARRQIEAMTLRIVNKLLHTPVATLRQVAGQDRHGVAYQHAVEKLFALKDSASKPVDS